MPYPHFESLSFPRKAFSTCVVRAFRQCVHYHQSHYVEGEQGESLVVHQYQAEHLV